VTGDFARGRFDGRRTAQVSKGGFVDKALGVVPGGHE